MSTRQIKSWLIMMICVGVITGVQARYYDAGETRFLTPDRFVKNPYNPQTLNRYSYVENNPINYTDPSGHLSWNVKNTWRGIEKSVSHPWRQSGAANWWNKNRYYVGTAALIVATAGTGAWAAGAGYSGLSGVMGAVLTGEITGAVAGGIAANAAGGDIGKGVFFGSAVGGVTSGASYGLFPGDTLRNMTGVKLLGARMAQGAILGTGYGASYGYAGGLGTQKGILRGMWNGAQLGAATGLVLGGAEWYAKGRGLAYGNFGVRGEPHFPGGHLQTISKTFQLSAQPMNAMLSVPLFHSLTVNTAHNVVGAGLTGYYSDATLRDLANQGGQKLIDDRLEDGISGKVRW